MEILAIQKINDYIDEFFPMKRGERISNPDETILFIKDIYISRRSLKHIVERRSINDGFSESDIKALLKKSQNIIVNPSIIIKNLSKNYPRSHLLGRLDMDFDKGIMVAVDDIGGKNYVITIFLKERRQFLKL